MFFSAILGVDSTLIWIADLANVWFGVSVFALKNCGFSVWSLPWFAGFLEFSLWFSVFVNNDGGFRIFYPVQILRFSGFAKEVTPRAVALKPVCNSKGPFI